MGLTDRLAGERPLEMSVAETASGEKTLERIIDIGRQLKEEDGAEALVMGVPAWRAIAAHWKRRSASR